MPLMPADVANLTFSKPPIGERGYHEDEVDVFLDLVEAELARLVEENNDLRNQVEQLDQQLRAALAAAGPRLHPAEPPRPVAPMPPSMEQTSSGGDHNGQAAKVLGLAQEMADRLTGEAKAEAAGMLGEARIKSERLLLDARVKAEGMVSEARTRVETMLDEARTRAETLDRQSREKAASLEHDAARRHTEIIAACSQEKSALDKKIDELRALEREYRTRLKTYLQSQLQDLKNLEGPGFIVSAPPTRHREGFVASGSGAHADAGSW